MRTIYTMGRTALLTGMLFITSLCFAGTAVLKFKVVGENNLRIPGVEIRVYNGNDVIQTELARTGRLKLKLATGNYYTIEVTRKGHVTKRLIVDTRAEAPIYGKHNYDFIVELHSTERYAQMDRADEFLDYPVTQIEFDANNQRFTYNRDYRFSSIEHRRAVFAEGSMFAAAEEE